MLRQRQAPGAPSSRRPDALPPPPAARCPRRERTGTGDLFGGGGGGGGGGKGERKGKERKRKGGEGEGGNAEDPENLAPNAPNLERGEKSFQKNLQAWIGVIFFFFLARWRGGSKLEAEWGG